MPTHKEEAALRPHDTEPCNTYQTQLYDGLIILKVQMNLFLYRVS